MSAKLKKMYDKVADMLSMSEESRDSDRVLYHHLCYKANKDALMSITAEEFILHPDKYGFPNYDSVTRARRKVQQEHPEFRSCVVVTEGRFKNWKEYTEWALGHKS